MADTLGFVTTIIRETFSRNKFIRIPEPMVMDKTEQVDAYTNSGKLEDGIMAASNLFHAAHATNVIHGCKRVIDLGCGPANQLMRIAALNPSTHFIGVELSREMIGHAHELVRDKEIKNIEFIQGDITLLDSFPDNSVDGVISTMTLHHLPSLEHLLTCFKQIRRVLSPNGALYIADFGRLKSIKSMSFFAHMHEKSLHEEVVRDYINSLQAAFSLEEFQYITDKVFPGSVKVCKTFLVPFMVIIKTPSNLICNQLKFRLTSYRDTLSPQFKRDLDDLRFFFRLGGLSEDPFT